MEQMAKGREAARPLVHFGMSGSSDHSGRNFAG